MSLLTNTHSRRSFLKSASACLALPYLETFSFAKDTKTEPIKRMLFLSQGYGFLPSFYPKEGGKFSKIGLTEGLSPLKRHKDDITLLGNLLNVGAAQPHAGSLTFLTGAPQSNKLQNTISCDQIAAEHLCKNNRYAHLTLSTKEKSGHGNCLSLAWNKQGSPIPGLNTSLELYKKLFSADESPEQVRRRIQTRRSVLDSLKVNAKSISHQIARTDLEKLDEYYQTIRQVELGLERQIKWANTPKPKSPFGHHPDQIDGEAEVKLMFDMIALAFQTDQTRVATYMMPSQSVLSSMGITTLVHALSHYNVSNERKQQAGLRDKKCTELFAYLLDRLKGMKDPDGRSVYDSCIVSYGTNIKSAHGIKGFPLFLSGGGIKNLRLGESIKLPKNTPLANVWLTLLQETGIKIDTFSHSTNTVSQILV